MGCLRQINCNNANLDLDVLLSFISYDNNNTTPKIIFHGYVKPCLDSLMVTKSLKSRGFIAMFRSNDHSSRWNGSG